MPPKKSGVATRSSARTKAKADVGAANLEKDEIEEQSDKMETDVKVEAGVKRTKDEAEEDEAAAPEESTPGDADDVDETKEGDEAAKDDDEETKEPPTKRTKVASEEPTPTTSLTEQDDGIIERGHIYFFYRTKVDLGTDGTTPSSIDDIAKFHFLLMPRSTELKQRFRFCVVGKKRLPDASKGKREVFWSSVEKCGEDFERDAKLGDTHESGLGEKNYSTKTRGDRHIEPARVAGRGHYALYSPKPRTPSQRATHLVYFLTHPSEKDMGDVQKELSVYTSGSFVIQVRNPTSNQNPPGVGLPASKRADYPEEVIEENFGGDADKSSGRKFNPLNPPGLMDFEGAELLLIADKEDAEVVLEGAEKVEKEMEHDAEEDAKKMDAEEVLKELKLDEETFPCDVLQGDWL